MNDPIVEEVRLARAEHAEKFGYDLKAIFADLRQQQRESGGEYVSFPAKRIPTESQEEPTRPRDVS